MARQKEFNRDTALDHAKLVFWQKGYNATSTDDLRLAMGIGRQSFYDTFKGKWETYLEVVKKYNDERLALYLEMFRKAETPLEGLENFLLIIAQDSEEKRKLGCLGVTSICEVGVEDKALQGIHKTSAESIESLLRMLIKEAQIKKYIRKELEPAKVSQYLMSMASGLRVSAKGGVPPKDLKAIANMAIKGLK